MAQVGKASASAVAGDRRIEAATRRMAPRIEKWLDKVIAQFVSQFKSKGWSVLKKADSLDAELQAILRLYGLRQLKSAARGSAKSFGGEWIAEPGQLQQFLDAKKDLGPLLRGELKRDLLRIIREAAKETPRPSISEVARRLREGTNLKGQPVGVSTAARAERIARAEMANAENTGIAEGLAAVGEDDDEVEWIAITGDRASGERQHWKMDGRTIKLKDMKGDDESKWFLTPLGNRCRYPGDTNLPIGDRIGCRCTHGLRLARKKR